jgi:hypothetical protein
MEESNYFVKTDPSQRPENENFIFLNYGGTMYIGNYNLKRKCYFVGTSELQWATIKYWLQPI